jgi:tripartite ATP-independent transporter DctP family solute receptor
MGGEEVRAMSKQIATVAAAACSISFGALMLFGGVQAQTTLPKAAASFPTMTIKLGTVAVGDPFYHLGSLKFAEFVKERTGGAVTIQVFPAGQLGNEKDLMEQVRNGVIEMTIGGTPMLSIFPSWGAVGAFAMPYVFKGNDERERLANFLKVARGPIGRELSEEGSKASGMRALDLAWWAGSQHLTTVSKKVATVTDVRNLKIRTPDTPIYRAALSAMGAAVTPMAWSEVYTALQLGVVDGMANTPDLIFNAKLGEVQKYLALTGHLAQVQAVLINENFYKRLSPELRAVLEKAAIDAGDYQNDLAIRGNDQYLERLKGQGMIVTPVNIAEFQESTKDAWKSFEPSFGKGVYEKILDAQK